MTISGISASKIFLGLQDGNHYVCVDFLKGEYIDCDTMTIGQLQALLSRQDTVRFYKKDLASEEESGGFN